MASLLGKTLAREPGSADGRKTALIALLETENSEVSKSKSAFDRDRRTLSEEYVNYYGDVVAAVSSLHDVRALSSLLGAITTGNMVTDALISFGKAAIHPVAQKLDDSDPLVRSSASWVLSQFPVRRPTLISRDPGAASEIQRALLSAALDSSPYVRRNAAEGLAYFDGPEVIRVLSRLAATDPFVQTRDASGKVFPVRVSAATSLETIKRRK